MSKVIIWDDRQRSHVKSLIDQLPGGGKFAVVIKKNVKQRSVDQNALMWKMLTQLGNELGYTSQEMHDIACEEINGVREIVLSDKTYHYVRGTSGMNTGEMTQFIDHLYRWALNEHGCLLEMPEPDYEQYAR